MIYFKLVRDGNMKKKVIRYVILLLLIPVVISTVLAIIQGNEQNKINVNNDSDLDIPTYSDNSIDEFKRSNSYIYASIFGLLIVSGGVWYYVKMKGEF
jgi:hypothetical protein